MQQIVEPPKLSQHTSNFVKYNQKRIIKESQFRPIVLNVKLASNPFLKDQEKFHFLIYKLNDYNKRVNNQQVTDPFECMCYERLHSIICDLPYIDTKQNQILQLEETIKWYQEQQKMIMQRKDQGEVRYEVTKQSKNGFQIEKQQAPVSQEIKQDTIPSKKMAKEVLPYKKGWRTTHKQLDIPARRLNQYKRKILNIAPFIQPKQEKKAPKILYPKMPRFDPKIDEPEEPVDEQNKQGQVGANGQVPPKQGEQQPPGGEQQAQPQQQEQQDLGGFGQQPGQPQQQEPPNEQDDKLAPKLKSFVLEKEDMIKKYEMKSAYQFYRGQQNETERRMEERYLKIYQNNIKKQKQENNLIQIADEWAHSKGKIEKQRQKRLQNARFSSKYSFCAEEPPKMEMLSPQQEIKFGFATMNIRNKPRHSEINLTAQHLPKIGQQNMYEKSIRKDRLNSLKSKYQKLLNLQQFQERQTAPSICQYTSRKRGLSEVIRNHSKSKERLNQLDQVMRIKQKLARGKVGVDIRSLSMGLCLPEDQTSFITNQQTGQVVFPDKQLPSNPFMVDTKKKKKKKK